MFSFASQLVCFQDKNFLYVLVLAFLPIWLWLGFLKREDKHHESFYRWFFIFLLGFGALILSYFGENFLTQIGLTDQSNPSAYFFYSALIEELAKFLIVFVFVFSWQGQRQPIEVMTDMGLVALGFAFFENFVVLCNSVLAGQFALIIIAILRFLGANFLHLLASVLIGFGYAESLKLRRIFPFLISFVFAVALHSSYNLLIALNNGENIYYIFPILWAAFFLVLKEFDIIKLKDERVRLHPSN